MPYVEPFGSKKLCKADNPDAGKGKIHRIGTSKAEDEDLGGGICMAMCLYWFKKIFQSQYKDVMWKMGDDAKAAKTAFLQYMINARDGRYLSAQIKLYEARGMTLHAKDGESSDNFYVGDFRENVGAAAVNWVKSTPELTCFSIGVPKHTTAGFWKKGAAFFFDPNEGVFEMSNINDFAVEVMDSIYQNYYEHNRELGIYIYKVTKGTS